MTCYQIDGDVKTENNANKVTFEANHSSVMNIDFFNEDLLLGSTPHNDHFSVLVHS